MNDSDELVLDIEVYEVKSVALTILSAEKGAASRVRHTEIIPIRPIVAPGAQKGSR